MLTRSLSIALATLLLVQAAAVSAEQKAVELTVAAGVTDLSDVPGWFTLAESAQASAALSDRSGALRALQVENGRGCLIVADLPRGTSRSYELVQEPLASARSPVVLVR